MVRSRKGSTVQRSNPLGPTNLQTGIRTDDDDDEEEGYIQTQQRHQVESNQTASLEEPLLKSDNHQASRQKKNDLEPFPTSTFLISSLIALGLFLLFFCLAPSISPLFPRSTTPHLSATTTTGPATDQSNPPTSSKKPTSKFVKPSAPPGSITDNTDNWANQGGGWKDSDPDAEDKIAEIGAPLFNGTHRFKKTVIIVSLDGFRAEYLERDLTPRLTTIREKLGISADYLEPQFPTLTFPNHWSMLTGLYPESHGIVANDFRDSKLGKSFSNIDPHRSWDPVWWGGEPIWATATKHGIRTAISMWPGPPYTIDKTRPTYWRAFEDRYKWWKKIRQLENWLDLPVKDRPELIALYVPDVDQMGHQYGPTAEKFNQSLQSVDRFVGALYDSLQARNLSEIIDVVMVGDHGMMATSDQRIVYLDQVLGHTYFNQIQFQDGWPAAGLRFLPEVDTRPILERLIEQSKILPGFEVYTHQTMPQRWHYTANDRIAPIYVFPKPGWVISNTHEHQVVMNGTYDVKGVHGYDNEEESMRSIFIGYGPFANTIKNNQLRSIRQSTTHPLVVGRLPKFSNLEIFSLISKLLELDRFIDFNQRNCSIGFWNQYF
ncbi:hypothetical protein PGT21_034593 [Puccinia graminis f. sp. tritici]|uniref:Uncharacterized protein n=1 Tax=Puccinia graminis f. sp. tritici TaxID=56615 RepID=A0A5B0RJ14_PUCGR|nr:hypothetical protein PGT21_034593 [Puccinia graminis f. sp. tritici]KAA1125667.1 hypothetical protein PGTUg99_018957 [Puccinia graminis f. sp. tritici]